MSLVKETLPFNNLFSTVCVPVLRYGDEQPIDNHSLHFILQVSNFVNKQTLQIVVRKDHTPFVALKSSM